jgi:multidrug resistance protein
MSAFNTTSDTESSLCVSIFVSSEWASRLHFTLIDYQVLGFAFGPLLLSPLSELYGRRIVYNISNIIFLAFTIACAVAPTMASFIFFRFMAGCLGGGPMNIGGGSIADCILPAKRGRIMSVFFMGIFLGPVLGPLIGGFLAKAAGWRWTLWIVAIMVCSASRRMYILLTRFIERNHDRNNFLFPC